MKTLQLLSVAFAAIAAVALAAPGCGSTVEEARPADASAADAARDAGASVDARPSAPDAALVDATAPRPDAGTPVQDACVPGPSILDAGIPDAAVSPDGGSTALCASCIAAACPAEVAACDAECECNIAANQLFACLGTGQSAFACAQQVGITQSPALQAVGQCAFGAQQCRAPCGVGAGFP